MDNQSATKMPKPFDTEETPSASAQQKQFELREDDRLKQEEDYRQGFFVFSTLNFKILFLFSELMKVQDEIVTLRQVLGAKLKRENELKTLLGVGFVDDLKQDWNETVTDIKSTTAYQKTAETLTAASEKIAPTLQSVNTSIKTGLGSLRSKNFRFFFSFRFVSSRCVTFRFGVF